MLHIRLLCANKNFYNFSTPASKLKSWLRAWSTCQIDGWSILSRQQSVVFVKLLTIAYYLPVRMFYKFHINVLLHSVVILQLCTVSVVVGMDAELEESSVDDVVQCEDRIVSQSQAFLPAGSRGEVQRQFDEILSQFGCETSLVVIRRATALLCTSSV